MELGGFSRISVVGTSCSGKTTLAVQLARLLDLPYVELDSIYWGPGWRPRPDFVDQVRLAVSNDRWVIDGNYGMVRSTIWERAEAVVWLNLPLRIVLSRAIRRTAQRIRSQEIVHGNRETLARAVLDPDGIPWWVLLSHGPRRRKFRRIFRRRAYPHLTVFELSSSREVSVLLEWTRRVCGQTR